MKKPSPGASKRVIAIAFFAFLLLTACAADVKVSGNVTDTWQWVSTYRCGKTICWQTHYMFVVGGQTYEDDWDGPYIRSGDHVSFTSAWYGIKDFHDDESHPYNWTWLIIGGIAVALLGIGEIVHKRIEDDEYEHS